MKTSSLCILAIDTAFTPSYLKHLRPVLAVDGKQIGIVELFDQKETDFRAHLIRLKECGSQDLFLFSTPSQVPLILRNAALLGMKPQFYNISVEGKEILEAGELAEGMIYPYSFDVDGGDPAVVHFSADYRRRFNRDPDAVAASTYDGIRLISQCAEEHGKEPEKIKGCLYGIRAYHGASGVFDIDLNGDARKRFFLKTVRDGRFIRLEEELVPGETARKH